jgi:pimeloyl-ACP methyl ester carboxylesterase
MLLLLFSVNTFALDVVGDWHGQLDIQGMKLRLTFHISKDGNAYKSTMDSPDQAAMGIPTTSTTFANNELYVIVKDLGAEYKGKLDGNKIAGTFTQRGMQMALVLRKEALAKATQKSRPQDPIKPYNYMVENINFINPSANNIKFAATLTLPIGINNPPVAVLISGSGPQNRDEEIKAFNHRPFLVWSDYLSNHGIAVLRYDDRGVAESEGSREKATSLDYASDAQAAVNYLKTRTDVIDVDKIGLIGHSEGGLIAPMIAAKDKDIAFIVLLAGPGVDGAEILLSQSKRAAELAGEKIADIELNQEISKQVFDVVKKELNLERLKQKIHTILHAAKDLHPEMMPKDFSDKQIQQQANSVSSPWMSNFIRSNPAAFLSKVKCPTLAINGELDFQVLPELNLTAIERSLHIANNQDITIKQLKGLNHLLQTAKTGALEEYAKIEETVSPVALELVTDWINKRFSGK